MSNAQITDLEWCLYLRIPNYYNNS